MNLQTVPRDPQQPSQRTRRALDLLADIMNSLILKGTVALFGLSDWRIVFPGSVSAENVLATYSLTGASGVWVNTGVSVLTLPSAGTYRIAADLRPDVNMAAGNFMSARLYNTTAAAAVTSSERLLTYNAAAQQLSFTVGLSWLLAVTVVTTLNLSVKREGGGAWTQSDLTSDANGRSTFGYEKLF